MTTPYPFASFFNSDLYSDVDVELANYERLKCHRVILDQSKVFASALAPSSSSKDFTKRVLCLHRDDPAIVKAAIQHLYTGNYFLPVNSGNLDCLMFHVSMYVFGEIHLLEDLKTAAKIRILNYQDLKSSAEEWLPVFRAIYDTKPGHDEGLRNVAVQITLPRISEWLLNEEFKSMLDEVGSFGKDLLLATCNPQRQSEDIVTLYVCDRCGGMRCDCSPYLLNNGKNFLK